MRNELATRRNVLKSSGVLAAATLAGGGVAKAIEDKPAAGGKVVKNGNIKHTACRWCYGSIPLDELCAHAVRIGMVGLDLINPSDFGTLKKHGLISTMTSPGGPVGITKGFNRREFHDGLIEELKRSIDATSENGWRNVICFSGNREGQSDDEGIAICTEGLKKIVGYAEQKKVTLCMELLNSKVDHADYQCDHTKWGVELCKSVGSDRFKLLYDIYHMQIMEGDVIRTIRENKDYLAHFHTGGVPGRHEIDESQELFYPAIMKAIVELKLDVYVAQEFIPARDPIASLEQGVSICDV